MHLFFRTTSQIGPSSLLPPQSPMYICIEYAEGQELFSFCPMKISEEIRREQPGGGSPTELPFQLTKKTTS